MFHFEYHCDKFIIKQQKNEPHLINFHYPINSVRSFKKLSSAVFHNFLLLHRCKKKMKTIFALIMLVVSSCKAVDEGKSYNVVRLGLQSSRDKI